MNLETSAACMGKQHTLKLSTDHKKDLPGRQTGSFASILGNIPQLYSELQFCLDQNGVIVDWFAGDTVGTYATSEELLGKHYLDVLPSRVCVSFFDAFTKTMQTGQVSAFEYDLQVGLEIYWHSVSCIQINQSNLIFIIRDTTQQKIMTDLAQRHQQFMVALQEIAGQFAGEADSWALGRHIIHTCVDQIGASGAWLGWVKDGTCFQDYVYTQTKDDQTDLDQQINVSANELATLQKTKKHLVIEQKTGQRGTKFIRAFFPLVSKEIVFGVLGVIVDTPNFFTSECINFFQTYALLVASTFQNVRLNEDAQRQLRRLQTLQIIDQAILSNLDFKSTIAVILQEVAKHIHVDALALLILDPKAQMLNFVDGFGFRYDTFRHSHLKIGAGFAGQVVLEKRVLYVDNLQDDPQSFAQSTNFKDEGFMMYLGTPLVVRSEVKGVLEIFKREHFEPSADWLAFLETLANQIAIAIDNSLLVKFLQDSNNELSTAYNATIEGLSQALELRDRETEGHTRRVAEMTVSLAQKMGFSDEEINQIRQGALLHDIGKMGIPDAILLKPEKLTAEEWKTMRKHPLYAYQLLSRVEHLKFGIDIPLYHHEKWCGNGYPYGLKGEQIPLSARMFAFADVYDALTSDRPYRSAWTKEQTLAYIRSQAGIHFDPAILPAFEELVQ